MRYMWIVNPARSPSAVIQWLEDDEADFAKRIMHIDGRIVWAMITDYDTWRDARATGWTDKGWTWSVTACNKQYAVRLETGEYEGALGNITISEAAGAKWWVKDQDTGLIWAPLDRNPNRIIPTETLDSKIQIKWEHAGRADKPSSKPIPQDRPWPLKAQPTYEEWKQGVLDTLTVSVSEALDKAFG